MACFKRKIPMKLSKGAQIIDTNNGPHLRLGSDDDFSVISQYLSHHLELLAGRDEGIPVDFAYPLLVELVRNPTWNWESREDVVYNQCAHSPSSANSQSGQAHKSAGRSGMGAVRGSRARR
eukprot:GEMP01042161.1.p1 GENE.GEMP01042161.1~~GEMP01042161.1.p1  ORF type:complete len:121 (+),score=24.62 GEMP01042161.1:140-502(+)